MKKKLLAGLACGVMMLGMTGAASAAPISWSTGSYSQDAIGDTWGTTYDILNITGLSGTIDLNNNTSTTIDINNYDFIVGNNTDYAHISPSYTALRTLTFGGVSSITQNYYVDISYSDTLHIADSALYSYDLGSAGQYTMLIGGVDIAYSPGTQHGSLSATISRNDVPEPATMLLMGSGLLGFVAVNRRRKDKEI